MINLLWFSHLVATSEVLATGAETNGFGVIEDTAACRKVYLGHPSVEPRVALLDPELTLGLPLAATAATGIDALVHGIESPASRGANAFSTAYAAQAVAMIGHALPLAHRDGSDLQARAELMMGAHLAGQALTLSGLGLVHGIGHALTARTGTPHGVALAAVLEEVMEFSTPRAREPYERAALAPDVAPPADGDWPRCGSCPAPSASGARCARSARTARCCRRSRRARSRTRCRRTRPGCPRSGRSWSYSPACTDPSGRA
jgi:alcohol dehydrogenase